MTQKIHLRQKQLFGYSEFHGEFDILENKDRSTVGSKAPPGPPKAMSLNLGTIRYIVPPQRKKKMKTGTFSSTTIMINRSPEEIFMLSQMAPATHSDAIRNEYFLNVNIKYDGCTCCSPLPSISVPLTVIPMTHMESYGF